MAQAAGVNSGGPNSSGPLQVPPQAQPAPSQKPDPEGSNAQQPPDGEIIYRVGQKSDKVEVRKTSVDHVINFFT
jgi:hypothetical protein